MKKIAIIALSAVVLAGCASKQAQQPLVTTSQSVPQPEPHFEKPSETVPLPSAETQNFSHSQPSNDLESTNKVRVQQCRKELDAMRIYSKASYDKYLAEFQRVGAQTNKYLQVKDAIGADIVDLVTPRYQFQIRELCFRIKNRLSQLIINAAAS